MIDGDKTISHLQIIRTWAAVNPRYGMGIDMSDGEKVIEWIDDALGLLKMQEPKTIVNKWHKNPLGGLFTFTLSMV